MKRTTLLLTLSFLSLAAAPDARAADATQTFRHDADGFGIQVPAGWTPLPAATLEEASRNLKSVSGSAPVFDYRHGYQRDEGPPYPIYPFVLIQVNDRTRFSEREFADVTKARAGIEKGLRTVEEKAGAVVSNARLGELVYDTNGHIVWLNIEMQVAGVGAARGVSGMVLTEKGFIQVNCYALKRDFAGLSDTFERIVRSVEVSEALRYKPRRGGLAFLRDFKSGGVANTAIIGGIVGGLAGLIIALTRRKKKPQPPPLP